MIWFWRRAPNHAGVDSLQTDRPRFSPPTRGHVAGGGSAARTFNSPAPSIVLDAGRHRDLPTRRRWRFTHRWNAATESVRRFSSLGPICLWSAIWSKGRVAFVRRVSGGRKAGLRARFPPPARRGMGVFFIQSALRRRAPGGMRVLYAAMCAVSLTRWCRRAMAAGCSRARAVGWGRPAGGAGLCPPGLAPDVGLRLEWALLPGGWVFAGAGQYSIGGYRRAQRVVICRHPPPVICSWPCFCPALPIRASAAQVNESTASAPARAFCSSKWLCRRRGEFIPPRSLSSLEPSCARSAGCLVAGRGGADFQCGWWQR